MENQDIRSYAKTNGVLLWEVAEMVGLSDSAFSRRLRRELPSDQREHIMRVIEAIAAYKAGRQEAEA